MKWTIGIAIRRYGWLAGVAMSAVACLSTVWLVSHVDSSLFAVEDAVMDDEEARLDLVPPAPEEYRSVALSYRNRDDLVLQYLRSPEARPDVISFFSAIVNSPLVAETIVREAEVHGVSPSLAVALAWEESRFVRTAVNRNRNSIDRGLFQLNNKSFPKLEEEDFFDIDINTRNGIAHLKWCLDHAGNEVSGLAMYNAGTTRVKKNTTPKMTLDYVNRILTFRAGIDDLFEDEIKRAWYLMADGTVRSVAPIEVQAVAQAQPRLKSLFRGKTSD